MSRIIGLSGTFASGKDTLAHHLVQTKDFLHISTGDMVRAVAEAEYGDTERSTLVKTANELRDKRGPGVLSELAMERFISHQDEYQGVIISGVRSLGEAQAIKDAGGTLVFVDAPIEIRYQRIKARRRAHEDELTFDQFKASEDTETKAVHDDPAVQDISGVKELADVYLTNNGDVAAFFADADAALKHV